MFSKRPVLFKKRVYNQAGSGTLVGGGKLNARQRKVLVVMAAVILIMLIYPPYRINRKYYIESGYDFFFDLPSDAIIDTTTLLVQWVGVIIVGALCYLLFRGDKKSMVEQHTMTPYEERAYSQALSELQSGQAHPGFWARAIAESEGDERKSKALYINLRVQQIMNSIMDGKGKAELNSTESVQRKVLAIEAALRHLDSQGYKITKRNAYWVVREPLGGRLKLHTDDELLGYAGDRIGLHSESSIVTSSTQQAGRPGSGLQYSTTSTVSPSVPHCTKNAINIQQEGPFGIGGWLLLLVLAMMVIGPIFGTGYLAANLAAVENIYPEVTAKPAWQAFIMAEWLSFAFFAALSFYGGLGLVRSRNSSAVKRAQVILWLIGPVATVFHELLIPIATLGDSYKVGAPILVSFIVSIMTTFVWVSYLSRSKRVRNTYFASE